MSYEKPPYDATIGNIKLLCEESRDVSETDKDELEEGVEDLQGSTFSRTLEAAVQLGLFEKTENGYKPTTEGKRIGYGRLSDEEEKELFRSLVKQYDFYNTLLEIVGGSLTSDDGEQYLEREVVQSEMGINFDFGVSDRTLESAAGTFLQVLDECGVGEYKRGQSGYPTRLVVNEEYSEFLSDSASEEPEDEEPTQEELPIDEDDEEGNNNEKENKDLESSDGTTPSSPINSQEENVEVSQTIEESIESGFDVTVNIEISSADWESEEVTSLINSLKNKDLE
ncbi:hypothetical protein ACFQH2_00950 [Natronoarchaeum sp. GCM10025703]|uniref:hypothetical protein n=1 Tax=unclassified Natronoarchaeum TaxID=2620183 RepID=UPI0036119695